MADTSLIFNLVARDRASQVVSGAAEKISTASAGIGAAAGMAMAKGVTDFLNVEKANAKLSAQLGLTAPESERIGKVAGDLYADAYGGSMEEVNAAVGSVMSSIKGMSDASSKDIEAASKKALDFATAFDTEVTEAVQAVSSLINSGLADSSTEAFDLMTKASQKVPAAMRPNLLEATNEYGQFFDTLGFDGQEAFSVLVDASSKGEFGIDKAGDAVKEFTILSTDMSTASQDAYKAIGLDAHEMANAILAGGDQAKNATDKIIDGILGIEDPATRANTAIALFGTPIEDLNVRDIPDFLKSLKGGSDAMEGFGGSSKRMGKTLNDNAATALETFKRQAEMKLAEVGGSFVMFALDHQEVFKPLAIGLGAVAVAVLAIKAGMIVYNAVMTVTRVATASWAAVQWVLNAAFWANPMTWIIAGIVALIAVVVLIATKTTWFQDAWSAMTDAVAAAWRWTWNLVKRIGQFILSFFLNWTIVGLIIKHWDKISSGTKRVWNWILGFVKAIPGRVVSFFLNWTLAGRIIKHFGEAKDGAIRAGGRLVDWVRGLPDRIIRGVGDLGSLLYGSGRSLIWGFVDGIQSMFGEVGNAVGGLVGYARDFFPFSPAKRGPFSGHGWSLYSGQAVAEDFAQGVTSRVDVAQGAMSEVMGATAAPLAAGPAPSMPLLTATPRAVPVVLELVGDRDLVRMFRRAARTRGGSIEIAAT